MFIGRVGTGGLRGLGLVLMRMGRLSLWPIWLKAGLPEACRKSGAGETAYREPTDVMWVPRGHRLFCVNANPPWPHTSLGVSLLTGHGSLAAASPNSSLAASQWKGVPLLTGSPRASLVAPT
jgi:hypothetical protein